jgi:MYXO-CTERM domain-containing protein
MVDEHAVDEICNDTDDDCDGEVDEGLSCAVADGSVSTHDAGADPDRVGELHAGCGCRASGAGRAPAGLAWIAILMLAWPLRRRRRGTSVVSGLSAPTTKR